MTTAKHTSPSSHGVPEVGNPPAFPMTRRCPFSPPEEYRALREQGPLVRVRLPSGQHSWVVTRYAEAKQVLTDPRISTDPTQPGFPTTNPESCEAGQRPEGQFIDMDPPEHTAYRRMLISEFSVRRINQLRPAIQRVVDQRVDAMLAEGGPLDLVEWFGLPVPSIVICELLGVPYADHEYFESRTRTFARLTTDPAEANAAVRELRGYLAELVARVEREPNDGLVSRLFTERVATGELTREALAGMAFLLLLAGHETTANMIPLSVLSLLENPAALAEIRADPGLLPGAVEELLRFHSAVDWVAFDRMAVEDVEIGGQLVRAGEGIYVLGASANRDERAFDRPDEFDIHRGARNHLAFGNGVHQCLGQNLARAELEIALRTLFERMPTLRLARPVAELPLKSDSAIFGLAELPVTW
ncbi:cytochrome P450 [Goodfellowiella coeruleoviolacea]|uniref:Cytochrome P450 n=1 Tax=Goodfellowiella coeruleoviolacea TaxID=334858 RepID=A0AAE3KFV7_9PSEU|nr:cytochrome P450 [Goodfellowiella coeruleoviolacea]MCP2166746.1 Cytochrome P450 [Goodfellowiella coeruleoviolacea]